MRQILQLAHLKWNENIVNAISVRERTENYAKDYPGMKCLIISAVLTRILHKTVLMKFDWSEPILLK